MADDTQLVTVFRSADESAEDDARGIAELLEADGLQPAVVDDDTPGVPVGAWEVRVPADQAERAEQLVAEAPSSEDEVAVVDESPGLEAETVFRADAGTTAELEAIGVKNLLEANGIAAVLIGDSVLPNLGFEVRVAREQVEQARTVIAEAEATGPESAEEAASETEAGGQTL